MSFIFNNKDYTHFPDGVYSVLITPFTEDNQINYSEPVKTTNKTDIIIGRIRHTIEDKKIYEFFISGDQLLKGAAYNSVQILKELIILS